MGKGGGGGGGSEGERGGGGGYTHIVICTMLAPNHTQTRMQLL